MTPSGCRKPLNYFKPIIHRLLQATSQHNTLLQCSVQHLKVLLYPK